MMRVPPAPPSRESEHLGYCWLPPTIGPVRAPLSMSEIVCARAWAHVAVCMVIGVRTEQRNAPSSKGNITNEHSKHTALLDSPAGKLTNPSFGAFTIPSMCWLLVLRDSDCATQLIPIWYTYIHYCVPYPFWLKQVWPKKSLPTQLRSHSSAGCHEECCLRVLHVRSSLGRMDFKMFS